MKKYNVSKGFYLNITTNWLNCMHFPLMEIYDRNEESETSEISAMLFSNWNKFILICTPYCLSGRIFQWSGTELQHSYFSKF